MEEQIKILEERIDALEINKDRLYYLTTKLRENQEKVTGILDKLVNNFLNKQRDESSSVGEE